MNRRGSDAAAVLFLQQHTGHVFLSLARKSNSFSLTGDH
jgi:hypothetical protein